jgi:hypothetical protein
MRIQVFFVLVAAILAVSILAGFVFSDQPTPSQQPLTIQTIIIRPDGSLSPSDVPIQRNDNVYTFTDNIYATLKIQRSNIVLDGAGYTLRGPYNGSQTDVWVVGNGPDQEPASIAEWVIGVDFSGANVQGVTIENLNVKNFSIGMYIWTKNNTVSTNSVSENIVGILLSGQNNCIKQNLIENNKQGLFMGFNNEGNTSIPPDISIHHNDFRTNSVQLNGCNCLGINSSEAPHNWDDGREGNYWSNYNGTDTNGDGIGDTPYIVDVLNHDRYPMMQSPVHLSAVAPKFPFGIVFFVVAFVLIAFFAAGAIRFFRKK